jgi:hypothetical protein
LPRQLQKEKEEGKRKSKAPQKIKDFFAKKGR